MSENINILPNRFESYVIEKPSEYRVVNSPLAKAKGELTVDTSIIMT